MLKLYYLLVVLWFSLVIFLLIKHPASDLWGIRTICYEKTEYVRVPLMIGYTLTTKLNLDGKPIKCEKE